VPPFAIRPPSLRRTLRGHPQIVASDAVSSTVEKLSGLLWGEAEIVGADFGYLSAGAHPRQGEWWATRVFALPPFIYTLSSCKKESLDLGTLSAQIVLP
jgi:hypothetical protein